MQTTTRSIRTAIALVASAVAFTACANDATAPTAASTTALDNTSIAGSNSTSSARSATRIRLIANLSPIAGGGFARASGKAQWDSRNNNTVRELEMQVEDVRAGTQVQFFVNGVRYGATVTVDALRRASIKLSTQLGQTVPTAAAGLTAEVRTTGGSVIVRGVFPTS